jgi:hypothetical protein
MIDTRISSSVQSTAEAGGVSPPLRSYRAANTVAMYAGAIPGTTSAEVQSALDRLGRALGGAQPLRRDVPPGHYLSILL